VPEPCGSWESVGDIDGLRIELVDPQDDTAMRTWNELIIREHPWGAGRLVGRQLRYLIRSDHGLLGAVGFASSALELSARERWIGWSSTERRVHLDRVLNLSRLLIRPSVHCKNLASWTVGACTRRIADDFERRYGFEPWLLETFVDEEQHEGTCFRASNWERIGLTKGRGRNDRAGRAERSKKAVYMYPLVDDFRDRMGVAPDRGAYLRPLPVEHGLADDEWIEQEFGDVELGDKRLRDRLKKIVSDCARRPDASYATASDGDKAAIKGFYAFVDNTRDEVNPEAILAAHRERTIGRMMAQSFVLVAQDTTDLNFSSRPQTKGLGQVGKNQTGAKSHGLQLHTSLAMTEDGIPLGVLKSVAYAPVDRGAKPLPPGAPIEDKESFKWIEHHRGCIEICKRIPETRILSIMDREADIFELFADAAPTRHRAGLLVRAKWNRKLVDSERKLFEEMRESDSKATVEVPIPRQRWKKAKSGKSGQDGMPSREARLTLAFQPVTIPPTRPGLGPKAGVKLHAIYAREEQPPEGAAAIEWMLLTTEDVETVDDALRMLECYGRRWRIEEWHRVLKSACRALDHQHETAERLARVIAIDAVLAWRIQLMTLLGRKAPDLPAEVFFDEWEVKVLEILAKKYDPERSDAPLEVGEAIETVARLGGYLARRSDPPPGTKALVLGLVRFEGIVEGYRLGIAMNGGP
jgi:hypothetical protein